MFSQKDINNLVENEVMQLIFKNQVYNFLPALYLGLLKYPTEELKALYKKRFKREYKSEDDLKYIIDKIKFLDIKINKTIEKPVQKNDKYSLSEMVAVIESISVPISRDEKIIHFKSQYDLAIKKTEKHG
jgi:hypothetical protein